MIAIARRFPRWSRPRLSRLLVAPRIEVISMPPAAGDSVEVAIHGLVCGLCARRARSALLATPGVETACVDLEAGTATLRLAAGAAPDAGAMQRSLDRVVIGLAARRWIERIATTLRALRPRAAERRRR